MGTFAVVASALAIFVAPGFAVLRAAGFRCAHGEKPAYAFALSLALLTATFAGLLALRASIDAAPVALALSTLAACAAARLLCRGTYSPTARETRAAARAPRALLLTVTLASVVAAVLFAPVGSVDRWWYLAYVRSFVNTQPLTLAEPFLATGQPFARFGVHPWLFGLALWSRLGGADPVALYHHAAPVVAVLASASASLALATALLRNAATARTATLAAMLLWSGGTVPLLARAGEDKVLAAAALLPLLLAGLLRALRSGRRGDLAVLGGVATATAAVHALDYALALLVALPVALWSARRHATTRGPALAALALLLAVAVLPAAGGLMVRSRLHDIGAERSVVDHPVVRVHEARDRLVDLPGVGFVVNPRLLLHPFALLALFALPLLASRSRLPADDGLAVRDDAAGVLVKTAVAVPLALAFLPPLPWLAGAAIPPWMVYRVLWLLPLGALAALASTALARRIGRGKATAMAVLLALAAPVVVGATADRLAQARGLRAEPSGPAFAAMTDAVAALAPGSVLVAAPELAERLPALTGRAVVAALDRSTVVFAGSRERGEARLRARAAALLGDADATELAGLANVQPTHALFDPAAEDRPRCARVLGTWPRSDAPGFALCELDPARGPQVPPMPSLAGVEGRVIALGSCAARAPQPAHDREPATARKWARDRWSAAAPAVYCRVAVPESVRGRADLLLELTAGAGGAQDELRVLVRAGGRDVAMGSVRVSGASVATFALPTLDADRLDVRVVSGFLPAVRVSRVAIAQR